MSNRGLYEHLGLTSASAAILDQSDQDAARRRKDLRDQREADRLKRAGAKRSSFQTAESTRTAVQSSGDSQFMSDIWALSGFMKEVVEELPILVIVGLHLVSMGAFFAVYAMQPLILDNYFYGYFSTGSIEINQSLAVAAIGALIPVLIYMLVRLAISILVFSVIIGAIFALGYAIFYFVNWYWG